MVSKLELLPTTASSSKTIEDLDGTQLCSDILLRARRAVGGRIVSPWPDYNRLPWARA